MVCLTTHELGTCLGKVNVAIIDDIVIKPDKKIKEPNLTCLLPNNKSSNEHLYRVVVKSLFVKHWFLPKKYDPFLPRFNIINI